MTNSEQPGSGHEARIRIYNTGRVLEMDPHAGPVRTPILWHPCYVCGKPYSPFGYGVDLKREQLGRWYCAEHKPKG